MVVADHTGKTESQVCNTTKLPTFPFLIIQIIVDGVIVNQCRCRAAPSRNSKEAKDFCQSILFSNNMVS